MPTPAEQKALAFVAIVIALGGAVRIYRAGGSHAPTSSSAELQALARQTAAVDSAGAASRARRSRNTGRRMLASSSADSGAKPHLDARGFPPPNARIDVGPGPVATPAPLAGASRGTARLASPSTPIDLDSATEPEIEALPRVGPALARRIIANRDSAGPFGGLEGLRRVRGIGPATLALLRPLVTFSGQTRR